MTSWTAIDAREELEALPHSHRRLGAGALQVLVTLTLRSVETRVAVALEVDMHLSHEVDEDIIGEYGEEDGMVDRVRIVVRAGEWAAQRDEVLLQALNGVVDLVDEVPETADEAEDRARLCPASSCGSGKTQQVSAKRLEHSRRTPGDLSKHAIARIDVEEDGVEQVFDAVVRQRSLDLLVDDRRQARVDQVGKDEASGRPVVLQLSRRDDRRLRASNSGLSIGKLSGARGQKVRTASPTKGRTKMARPALLLIADVEPLSSSRCRMSRKTPTA